MLKLIAENSSRVLQPVSIHVQSPISLPLGSMLEA